MQEINSQQDEEIATDSLDLDGRAAPWQDKGQKPGQKLGQEEEQDTPKPRPRFSLVRSLIFLVILGAIAGGGFLVYQNFFVPQNNQGRRKARTVSVERATLPISVSANGTVQPEMLINVSPKSSGRLKQLLVKQGDLVETGQVLAYMDNSNLQGQLTQAQGDVASAEANLQKLMAGNRDQEIGQAQATLNSDRANLQQAEFNFNQNQALFNDGAISEREFKNSRSAFDAAKGKVAQSEQALSLQQAGSRPEDIAQARAQVVSAQGKLQIVQAQIEDTVIRAPFSGIVARKFADPGAFVTPTTSGSTVTSATASSILSLASNNRVIANVAEVNIAQVKVGQSVKIKADAYPGETFDGKVVEISPQSTVQQNVTSFEVKAAILSDAKQQLRSGMNTSVDFKVGDLKNALVVPTVAIVRQANATGVFVRSEDSPPVFTPIVTGLTANDKTEVKSGLKGGEKILISFPEGMRPQSNIPGGIPGLQPRVR
jgi:HlyD family secretion protein